MPRFIDIDPYERQENWTTRVTLVIENSTSIKSIPVYSIPTADVQPVVHGRWIYEDCIITFEGEYGGFFCSECGKGFLDDLCCNNGDETISVKEEFRFCPNCGAKMDGDAHE